MIKTRASACVLTTDEKIPPPLREPPIQLATDNPPSKPISSPTRLPTLSRLSNNADSKTSHRRSFLPQPGVGIDNGRGSMSNPVTSEYRHSQIGISGRQARPSSIYRGIASSTKPVEATNTDGKREGRVRTDEYTNNDSIAMGADTEESMPSQKLETSSKIEMPPPTGKGRSLSLRKPAASQLNRGPSIRSHARSKTALTGGATSKLAVAMVSNPLITDPKPDERSTSAASNSSNAKSVTSDVASGHTSNRQPPASNVSLKRSSTIIGQSSNKSSQPTTNNLMRPTSISALPARRRNTTINEGLSKPSKPAFSTLQQHFTPKKAPKPLTSSIVAPATSESPTIPSLSAETVRLQTELLQLHLLHESSHAVQQQWQHSASRKLQKHFEEVAALYEAIREAETQNQEQRNVAALRDWSSGGTTSGFTENVQILGSVLAELPALMDQDGRYTRLQEAFEAWASWIEDIWSARTSQVSAPAPASVPRQFEFAEELNDAWHVEQAVLARKLSQLSRDMDALVAPPDGSTLADVVRVCRTLVSGALEETRCMSIIERAYMTREREWVEGTLEGVGMDVGVGLEEDEKVSWRD